LKAPGNLKALGLQKIRFKAPIVLYDTLKMIQHLKQTKKQTKSYDIAAICSFFTSNKFKALECR
jgi:hypothetical protein